MHVLPAKHSYAWLPRKCDYRTDRWTDRQMLDKVIPMCRYALQVTQISYTIYVCTKSLLLLYELDKNLLKAVWIVNKFPNLKAKVNQICTTDTPTDRLTSSIHEQELLCKLSKYQKPDIWSLWQKQQSTILDIHEPLETRGETRSFALSLYVL